MTVAPTKPMFVGYPSSFFQVGKPIVPGVFLKFLNLNNRHAYMKVIGFLKNYNPELHCSKNLADLFVPTITEDQEQSNVIRYLNNNGVPIVSFISDIYTDEVELIGPYIIYSDGAWI